MFLVGAAIVLERRTVQIALIAFLAYSIPHFAYHLTTTDHYSTGDNVASLGGFAVELILAVALLFLAREIVRASEAQPPAASSPSRSSPS